MWLKIEPNTEQAVTNLEEFVIAPQVIFLRYTTVKATYNPTAPYAHETWVMIVSGSVLIVEL